MPWPLSQDYNEAIQSPATNFADPDLKRGEAVTNAMGLPMPCSGNFADVYQVHCCDGSRWAVKCFTREVPGLRKRYQIISGHLKQAKLPFTVDFSYLDQGIRVAGKWYPILKMQWVEGLTLNQFVSQHVDKPAMLEALAQIWRRMAQYLRGAEVGHCDLQHGNILLVPGGDAHHLALKLIDYDGMWVPELAKTKTGEIGHANYQHPRRLAEATYSLDVDRFPLLLVATSLHALKAKGAALWQKYDNADNLLFKESDLREPVKSQLFYELVKTNDPVVQPLLDHILTALRGGLETTPLLEEVLPLTQPTAITSARPPRLAPPAAATVAPVAPVAAAGGWDSLESTPTLMRPRRRQSVAGTQAIRIGVVAAVVVFAALAAVTAWSMNSRKPKDQSTQLATHPDPTPPKPSDAGADVPANDDHHTEETPDDGDKRNVERHSNEKPVAVSPTPVSPPSSVEVVHELRKFTGHDDPILFLQFAPDRAALVSASNGDHEVKDGKNAGRQAGADNSVSVWNIETGAEMHKFLFNERDHYGPMGLSLSPDGRYVAAASSWFGPKSPEPMIYIWDMKIENSPNIIHPAAEMSLGRAAFSRDGKAIDVLCGDGALRSWSFPEGEALRTVSLAEKDDKGNQFFLSLADFTPDGRYILGPGIHSEAAAASRVRLWDRRTGKAVRDFSANAVPFFKTVLSPDGTQLLACAGDRDNASNRCIKKWNVESGLENLSITPLDDNVRSLAFSPDGKQFAAGFGSLVRLYDASSGKELAQFVGHTDAVACLAFSPDGRQMATAGSDKTIRLWSVPGASALVASAPRPSPDDASPPAKTPTAPETDPIRVKLDKAKVEFNAAFEKFKQKVHESLDNAEKPARTVGNKTLVEEIIAERAAFDDNGSLPKKAPVTEFKAELDAARRTLVTAYDDAMKAYTKDNKDAMAKAVEEELKGFEQAHPLDAFRAGSVWTGKSVLVWLGHPDRRPGNITLTVLERDDKTFKATFEDGGSTRTVSGTIRGGEIKWLAKDVEVVKGGAGYNFTGQITGSRLKLLSDWNGRYFRKPFAPARIVLTGQLQLEKK